LTFDAGFFDASDTSSMRKELWPEEGGAVTDEGEAAGGLS
jgi:nucleoid-associated protein YgaU